MVCASGSEACYNFFVALNENMYEIAKKRLAWGLALPLEKARGSSSAARERGRGVQE